MPPAAPPDAVVDAPIPGAEVAAEGGAPPCGEQSKRCPVEEMDFSGAMGMFTTRLLRKAYRPSRRPAQCPAYVKECEEEFLELLRAAGRQQPHDRAQWHRSCGAFSDKWEHVCHWVHPSRLADFLTEDLGFEWCGEAPARPDVDKSKLKSVIKAQKFFCEECAVVCNSYAQYEIHSQGGRHRDNVAMRQNAAALQGLVYQEKGPQPVDGSAPQTALGDDSQQAHAYYKKAPDSPDTDSHTDSSLSPVSRAMAEVFGTPAPSRAGTTRGGAPQAACGSRSRRHRTVAPRLATNVVFAAMCSSLAPAGPGMAYAAGGGPEGGWDYGEPSDWHYGNWGHQWCENDRFGFSTAAWHHRAGSDQDRSNDREDADSCILVEDDDDDEEDGEHRVAGKAAAVRAGGRRACSVPTSPTALCRSMPGSPGVFSAPAPSSWADDEPDVDLLELPAARSPVGRPCPIRHLNPAAPAFVPCAPPPPPPSNSEEYRHFISTPASSFPAASASALAMSPSAGAMPPSASQEDLWRHSWGGSESAEPASAPESTPVPTERCTSTPAPSDAATLEVAPSEDLPLRDAGDVDTVHASVEILLASDDTSRSPAVEDVIAGVSPGAVAAGLAQACAAAGGDSCERAAALLKRADARYRGLAEAVAESIAHSLKAGPQVRPLSAEMGEEESEWAEDCNARELTRYAALFALGLSLAVSALSAGGPARITDNLDAFVSKSCGSDAEVAVPLAASTVAVQALNTLSDAIQRDEAAAAGGRWVGGRLRRLAGRCTLPRVADAIRKVADSADDATATGFISCRSMTA
eukprot:TRINITY_DN33_c0_g2_i1.p1 TRINITY_DN33_c0_g2~~TRINITY_DN33_c0_g2_i1.p1  ORF type:complete len:852 (+),score=262.94 TRINITY_DN33_c0_g2_i1:148-2556(+)